MTMRFIINVARLTYSYTYPVKSSIILHALVFSDLGGFVMFKIVYTILVATLVSVYYILVIYDKVVVLIFYHSYVLIRLFTQALFFIIQFFDNFSTQIIENGK